MAKVLLLRHPAAGVRFPPVRLTLTGATLLTDLDLHRAPEQELPSGEAAEAHLERVLRLRLDEGYRIVESGEIADGDVDLAGDPIRRLFHYMPVRRRARVQFERGPISPEEIAEVVARLAAAAPVCVNYVRGDEVPGGLLGAALAGKVLPSVKILTLFVDIPRTCGLPLDDLADLFAALPNLEQVEARGGFTLREARHGALAALHLGNDLGNAPLSPGILAALGDGSLPALSALDLSLGRDHGLDRATAAALRSVAAPRLRAVQVAGIEDVTRFLDALTEGPLPTSWATLYVRGSVGDEDELVAVLEQRAPALRSVATLGLPLADELSVGGVAAVKALLPRVLDACEVPDPWRRGMTEAW